MQGDGAFVDLREDRELVEDLLGPAGGQVGRHDLVERGILSGLVELIVEEQSFEISRLVVFYEMVRVDNDIKALLPKVARLDVLDVVLSVEHEGRLLVAGDLEVLIGEPIEDCYHFHLEHKLPQHQSKKYKQ